MFKVQSNMIYNSKFNSNIFFQTSSWKRVKLELEKNVCVKFGLGKSHGLVKSKFGLNQIALHCLSKNKVYKIINKLKESLFLKVYILSYSYWSHEH